MTILGICQLNANNVTVVDHPLVKHKLTIMRDKNTSSNEFRRLLREVSTFLAYEATRDLPLQEIEIETPVGPMTNAPVIAGKKLCLVSILRAGNGLLDGMLDLIPSARVGHIGLYRDPETFQAIEYYCKLPPSITEREVIVVDPMLATGNTAVAAIKKLKDHGVSNMKFICLVAAPQGIATFQKAHPEVPIFVAAIDSKLNDHAYIVPGLGDAGDRIYGTK